MKMKKLLNYLCEIISSINYSNGNNTITINISFYICSLSCLFNYTSVSNFDLIIFILVSFLIIYTRIIIQTNHPLRLFFYLLVKQISLIYRSEITGILCGIL